jgi:hypothetical protein
MLMQGQSEYKTKCGGACSIMMFLSCFVMILAFWVEAFRLFEETQITWDIKSYEYSHFRDDIVFPHNSSSFQEGIGLANGFKIAPEYGYFSIEVVVPSEIQSWNIELNMYDVQNVLVEFPVPTTGCNDTEHLSVSEFVITSH